MIFIRIYKAKKKKKRETSNSGGKKVHKKATHGQRKLDGQTL